MAVTPLELDGYRCDLEYNFDYHRYISPAHLRLLALSRGIAFPDPSSRPLRCLELGFGTGVSMVMHSAACPGDYWGTDASPDHVRTARALADAAGTDVKLFPLSFADLLEHGGLPQFDVIVANGVWSWVSAANRAVIVDILDRDGGDAAGLVGPRTVTPRNGGVDAREHAGIHLRLVAHAPVRATRGRRRAACRGRLTGTLAAGSLDRPLI